MPPSTPPPSPDALKNHPLVAAMSDPAINVRHAADLLHVKCEELCARVFVAFGGVPPELATLLVKAREAQLWANETALALAGLQQDQKPGIEIVGAMPHGL